MSNNYSYNITLADTTFSGPTATIQGSGLGSSDVLNIDASAETSTDISINGGGANDILMGGGGQDTIFGGNGDDSLKGKGSADTLTGHYGADTLNGGGGKDILIGGVNNGGTIMTEQAAGGVAVDNIYRFTEFMNSDFNGGAHDTWDVIKGFDTGDKIRLSDALNDNFTAGNTDVVFVKSFPGNWASITTADFFENSGGVDKSIVVMSDGADARLYVDGDGGGDLDGTDLVVKFDGLNSTADIDAISDYILT
jgi:hypothetical protein